MGAFYVFLMYTGLRLGEGLALKWKYIDFEKRTVYVSRTIVYVKDRTKNDGSKILIDQSTTKGGRGRTVFLSDMAIEALNDLKKEKGYDPEQYIVRSRYNTIIRPADAYKVFQRILKNSEIETDGIFILRDSISLGQLVPGLKLDGNHVEVDRKMQTNLKGCFAAGDIVGTPYQYIKAAGEGNIAALSAVAYIDEIKKR